jgi:hypothetical protein
MTSTRPTDETDSSEGPYNILAHNYLILFYSFEKYSRLNLQKLFCAVNCRILNVQKVEE